MLATIIKKTYAYNQQQDIEMINEHSRQKIENLMSLDENDLYSLLPAYCSEYDNTAFREEGQIKAGKKIFDSTLLKVKEKVCIEWNACEKVKNNDFADTITLIASIADIIMGIVGTIPPFVIATLMVKIGITKICNAK